MIFLSLPTDMVIDSIFFYFMKWQVTSIKCPEKNRSLLSQLINEKLLVCSVKDNQLKEIIDITAQREKDRPLFPEHY